jgi:NitT/TauT family transport system substrate-binding protein
VSIDVADEHRHHERMNRRTAIRSGAAALAAAAFAPFPARAQMRQLRIALVPIDNNALPFFAQEMGFFAKAGLNADVQQMQSGAAMTAAIAGGAVDVASSNIVQLAQAHEKRIPFTLLAPAGVYLPTAVTTILMASQSSPLRTAKDLTGKTIAVTGLKSIAQYAPMAWIDKHGGDSKTVKFVEMPVQEMGDAMAQNRVDAAVVQEPFIARAKKSARIYADVFGAIAPSFLVSAYFGTSDFATANPDLVRSFQRVMRDTAIWANKNHAKTADILVNTLHVDATVVPTMTRAIFAESLQPAQIQPVIEVAVKYGGISDFPASEMIYKA